MDFEKLILNRQSDRRYLPDPVSKNDIIKCLEAARMAPSACNSQPWKFIVVDDKERVLDLGMAVEHFCLQAADLGLGTCIMGWFNEKRIGKLLNVPRGKRIPLLITLGHPNNMTRRKSRKPMEEISSWNSY